MSPAEARTLRVGDRIVFAYSGYSGSEVGGKVVKITMHGRGPHARVITISWDDDWQGTYPARHPAFLQIEKDER